MGWGGARRDCPALPQPRGQGQQVLTTSAASVSGGRTANSTCPWGQVTRGNRGGPGGGLPPRPTLHWTGQHGGAPEARPQRRGAQRLCCRVRVRVRARNLRPHRTDAIGPACTHGVCLRARSHPIDRIALFCTARHMLPNAVAVSLAHPAKMMVSLYAVAALLGSAGAWVLPGTITQQYEDGRPVSCAEAGGGMSCRRVVTQRVHPFPPAGSAQGEQADVTQDAPGLQPLLAAAVQGA